MDANQPGTSGLQILLVWGGGVVLWQLAIMVMDATFLPSPVGVSTTLLHIVLGETFLRTVTITVVRVLAAISGVMTVGMFLLFAAKRYRPVRAIVHAGVFPLSYAVPPIIWVFVVLAVLGMSGISPVIIVMIVIFPYFFVNVVEGVNDLDTELVEMGDMFGDDRYRRFRHILFPLLLPHIIALLRSLLTAAWKAVLLAEFFTATEGIGYRLQVALGGYDIQAVFAWGVIVLVPVMVVDRVVRAADRRVLRPHLHID